MHSSCSIIDASSAIDQLPRLVGASSARKSWHAAACDLFPSSLQKLSVVFLSLSVTDNITPNTPQTPNPNTGQSKQIKKKIKVDFIFLFSKKIKIPNVSVTVNLAAS